MVGPTFALKKRRQRSLTMRLRFDLPFHLRFPADRLGLEAIADNRNNGTLIFCSVVIVGEVKRELGRCRTLADALVTALLLPRRCLCRRRSLAFLRRRSRRPRSFRLSLVLLDVVSRTCHWLVILRPADSSPKPPVTTAQ